MHFLTALLLTLTPTAAVLAAPAINEQTQSQPRAVLPDGFYLTEVLANGTLVHTSVTNPRALPIVQDGLAAPSLLAARDADHQLTRRRTDCWGRNLDAPAIDRLVNKWKAHLRQVSSVTLKAGASQHYLQYTDSSMTVYYCVNRKNSQGSLSYDDFNYALRKMDERCRAYEASFFQWDGSVEIVGKASLNDRVCIGDS